MRACVVAQFFFIKLYIYLFSEVLDSCRGHDVVKYFSTFVEISLLTDNQYKSDNCLMDDIPEPNNKINID